MDFLTKRRQRRNSGKPVWENKYAADVYYLYAFVEGIAFSDELQKKLSEQAKNEKC